MPTIAKYEAGPEGVWARFRSVYPDHGYLAHAQNLNHGIPLEATILFFSRADDGRSYKHLGIWVLS